ncbi:hypothetical protein C6990_00080 [Nitrosopumilus sp. b3]|uniref:hypothetical protein n=1 Tax=Nitrosopumilus sp. b3 TaxID=2109909 RepID=UPI0015F3D689|nr:hypothetical protein [Nitrosopumilus sp. b3]KAF6247895.1 hypothetical protein C6990_00080 [Nitrosopumilus sp. b3]
MSFESSNDPSVVKKLRSIGERVRVFEKDLSEFNEFVKENMPTTEVNEDSLKLETVEMLNKGIPIRNFSMKGIHFPLDIIPIASPILAGVTSALVLPSNVRQTKRDGWWPPLPAGPPPPPPNAPPPFPPLPAGFGDITLDDGDPDMPGWDPVNPTPNGHGKVIEYDDQTGKLSMSSAGQSVELDWEDLKPPQPIDSVPLPPEPCPDGSPRPKHDQVSVEVDEIKASIRESNCHTTIIISIKWKITRVRFRCSGTGRNRRWTRDPNQPRNPPREEFSSNHTSTRVSLPQN